MPKYHITTPDGKTFEVESPSELTDAQAYQYATQGSQGAASSVPSPKQGMIGKAWDLATEPMASPETQARVSGAIQGQQNKPLVRSQVPMIGPYLEGAKALPDVVSGLVHHPMPTLRGLAGGMAEGFAGLSPIDALQIGAPVAGKAVKGLSSMARAAEELKPLLGADQFAEAGSRIAKTGGRAVERFGKAPSIPEIAKGFEPYQQSLRVAENAPVSNAAQTAKQVGKAAERRSPTRVSDDATDKLYQRMREKIAQGEQTGTPELRQLGEKKSALDASRETAEVARKTPKNLLKGDAARDTTDSKRTIFGGVRESGDMVRPELRSPIRSAKLDKPASLMKDLASGKKELPPQLQKLGMDMFGSDKGAINPKMIGADPKVLKALGQLRSGSMLSGLALPMSIAGDLGSVVTAAAEHGTMKPIKELMNVPENLKALKTAWKAGANPAELSGSAGLNIPGRLIGMFDDATQALHARAGIPAKDAQRLLLQNPDYLLKGMRKMVPGSEIPFPFLKTNSNYFTEGLKHTLDLGNFSDSGMSLGKKAGTLATGAAGYETGKHTDSPSAIKLGGAAAGVRGIPFMIGAGIGAGRKSMEKGNKFGTGVRKAMGGFSPLQDMGITNLIADPKSGLAKMLGIEPAGLRLVKRKKAVKFTGDL